MSAFIRHLRLNFQLIVLAPAFLLGGVFAGDLDLPTWIMQFILVHVFLYGGTTVFNSRHDRDEGAVSGAEKLPPVEPWMNTLAWVLQFAGLFLGLLDNKFPSFSGNEPLTLNLHFAAFYGVSMLLFWFYSTPHIRWKSNPWLGIFALSLGSGFNAFFMGWHAAHGNGQDVWVLLSAALGASLLLAAFYPLTQIYQIDEDRRRGDKTFAAVFGVAAVKRLFVLLYFTGMILTAFSLFFIDSVLALSLGITGTAAGIISMAWLGNMDDRPKAWGNVMRFVFINTILFDIALIAALWWRAN